MAEAECCLLGGDISCGDYCLTSVNTSSNTEVSQACGLDATPIIGPTTGTISITGYIKKTPHYACIGEAGVSINWVKKYDCINDVTHFIFAGEGNSYYFGDVEGYATLHTEILTHTSISANVGNSGSSLVTKSERHEGFGMTWTGGPIIFATDAEIGVVLADGLCEIGGPLFLTNFNARFPMGEVPTATYTFVYNISSEEA